MADSLKARTLRGALWALVAGGVCGALVYLALAWVFRFDFVQEGKRALALK